MGRLYHEGVLLNNKQINFIGHHTPDTMYVGDGTGTRNRFDMNLDDEVLDDERDSFEKIFSGKVGLRRMARIHVVAWLGDEDTEPHKANTKYRSKK